MKPFLTALFLTAFVAGCMSRNKMRNLPSDAGLQHVYKADFEKARMAARDGLTGAGFNLHDDVSLSEGVWRMQGFKSTAANPAFSDCRVGA